MNKIEKINAQLNEEMDNFKQHFPMEQMIQEEINTHLKQVHEQEFIITKNRQIKVKQSH